MNTTARDGKTYLPLSVLLGMKLPRNPKRHANDRLARVIDDVGFIDTPTINAVTDHILGGHGRVDDLARRRDGGEPPPAEIVMLDGDWGVPVHVVEVAAEKEEYAALALNGLTEAGGYDDALLLQVIQDVEAALGKDAPANAGFDEDRVAAIRAEVDAALAEQRAADAPEDPGAQVDRAEELNEKWQVVTGDLWEIPSVATPGKCHRLLCGDSTKEGDVAQLMGGERADMLHIDPPYGINIIKPKSNSPFRAADSGGAKPFGATPGINRKSSTGFDSARLGSVQVGPKSPNQIIQSNLYPPIHGDDEPFDPLPLLDFAPVVIMWGANYFADKLPIKAGWIVWDKRENITRNSFADCEIAWTNRNGPARIFYHLWSGLFKGSQHGERRTHPTEKPVALFAEVGSLFAQGGLWVDLFAGSGAQLIAAEKTGAICFACEYESPYVAVALERLADLGLKPRRVASSADSVQ